MKEAGEKKGKSNTRRVVNGLINYSVAAAATVAVTQPAQAAVVQSGPQNIILNPGDCYYIDLNGDMIDDFDLCLYHYTYNSATYTYGILYNALGNGAMLRAPYKYTPRLCSEVVPQDTYWSFFLAYTHLGYQYGNYDYRYGQFWGKSGSIGVRFEIPDGGDSETHYGYIRIGVDRNGDLINIMDWAYESVPEQSIMTPACDRAINAKPTSVPTLNQWGILILMGLILLEGGRRLNKDNGEEA